jgi:hypothetical protein
MHVTLCKKTAGQTVGRLLTFLGASAPTERLQEVPRTP